jgi:hypothetical protein
MMRWKWITSSVLLAACSAATPAGSSLSGATPVTESVLVGCSPLEVGCYTFDGAYESPMSAPSCASPGGATQGAADKHCDKTPPTAVSAASCGVMPPSEDAGAAPTVTSGLCGENGADYGTTMYGTEGDDDDCKYHVSFTSSPLCENDGTYFVVTAHYLTRDGAPLTGACAFAELCLNDSHVIPSADYRPPTGKQVVVEGPPGTYTIGPVTLDEAGKWTVRFHFNEQCCDVADSSPHGHAAFFVNVP